MNSKRKQGRATKTHNNRTGNAAGSRKGALISAAATIGLLTSQCGDYYEGSSMYAQAMKVDQSMAMHGVDVVGSDDIGKSSADDMFAFSQIVASGGNPMEVAAQIEKEAAAKKQEEKKIGGLSEDQAMAAFAEFVSGEGGDPTAVDPKKLQAEKEAAAKAAKAKAELKELATNDATSAFASLVESQVTEEKASTYEGSGGQADQEAAAAKGQAPLPKKPDALLAVQKQSEAELTEANQQVESTDCAQEAATRLGSAGNVQTAEDNANAPAEGAEAAAPKAPKPAAKKAQAKPAAKPKSAPAKKAAPAAKPQSASKATAGAQGAAAAKSAEPERPTVDLAASLAANESKEQEQVDQQADEILDQIKSAAVGIKGLGAGGGGDGVDEQALQAAMKGMNLLQLDADIRDHELPDDNAQLAMEYLAQQFPDEYPRDTPKPAPVKGPTPEEKETSEKQALLAYAQRVTEEATESRDRVVADIADKEERRKLARMGMEGEPVALQLSSENLLQLQGSIQFDADALEAQDYLESQFPDEFPKDKAPSMAPATPSPEEIEKKKQQEFLKFAEHVTEAATESRDKVVQDINDKKEKAELATMGVSKEELPQKKKPVDWKVIEANRKDNSYLQVGADMHDDSNIHSSNLVQLNQEIVLDEQNQEKQNELNSENADAANSELMLAQISQKSKEKVVSESEASEALVLQESAEEGAEQETMVQPALAQSDLSGMSADDMRSYSESVAQAADVVNSESELEKAKEVDPKSKGQLAQAKLDKQSQKPANNKLNGQKEDPQPNDLDAKAADPKSSELEAKAAMVAQAEAANQAAIEDTSGQVASAKGVTAGKEASLEELDADQKKEQAKQAASAKYAQDKKAALEQGYTEEQAELFAKQEAQLTKAKQAPAQPTPSAPTQEPPQAATAAPVATDPDQEAAKAAPVQASGPNVVPPTMIGRDQAQAMKEAAPTTDQAADLVAATAAAAPAQTPEDTSIEQQIKQAQEQQALIKAQIEKKKQEKQNLLAMNTIAGNVATVQGQNTVKKVVKPVSVPQQQQQDIQAATQPDMAQKAQEQAQAAVIPAEQADQDAQQLAQQAVSDQPQAKVPVQQVQQALSQQEMKANALELQKQQEEAAQIQAQEQAFQMVQQQQQQEAAQLQQAQLQALQAEQEVPDDHTDTKTHKREKSTLQQSEEIHRHTPKEIKKQLKQLNKGKSRAQQYEEDLNKARDEIQRAQIEMKNIDSEVADFHQKMAKSMHSLLKAFTEGFEAMDKAKSDELDSQMAERAEKKRANKLDKLNLGISNLQALTSKLKMSFGDENKEAAPIQNEAVQSNADIHQSSSTAAGQKQIQVNQVANQKSSPVKVNNMPVQKPISIQNKQANSKPPASPAQNMKSQSTNQIKNVANQQKVSVAKKQMPPPVQAQKPTQQLSQQTQQQKAQQKTQQSHSSTQAKKAVVKQSSAVPQAKNVKPGKKALPVAHQAVKKVGQQPAQVLAQSKQLSKSTASQKTQVVAKTAAKQTAVKPAKTKAISASQIKVQPIKVQQKTLVQPKSAPAKPATKLIQLKKKSATKPLKIALKQKSGKMAKSAVGLAQLTESSLDLEKNSLIQTGEQVNLKSAENNGVTTNESQGDESRDDSDQMMAHTISDRILMQLEQGKSQEAIIADLSKTKEALQLAKKAYYDKDPQAIQLLQLQDENSC